MSFSKYSKLCELEAKHGVAIGTAYTNNIAERTFCHYVAESKRQDLLEILTRVIFFFSFLIDGSTDSGNIDNEIFMATYCDTNEGDERVHTKTSFFLDIRPSSVAATGLYECIRKGIMSLRISEVSSEYCTKLVGIGTDDATPNIAKKGLKWIIEKIRMDLLDVVLSTQTRTSCNKNVGT